MKYILALLVLIAGPAMAQESQFVFVPRAECNLKMTIAELIIFLSMIANIAARTTSILQCIYIQPA